MLFLLAQMGQAGALAPAAFFVTDSIMGHRKKTVVPTRLRRWLATLLIVVGLLMAGEGVYIAAKAQLAQWLLDRSWHALVSDGVATPPWPWADTRPVGRLEVPRLGVDLLLLSGASMRNLAFGPVVSGGGALADQDQWVLSAHRDTHFAFLADVRPGDEIAVVLPSGARQSYRVSSQEVADVRRDQLAPLNHSAALYLVTCYPLQGITSDPDKRLVITAQAL